ncbi:tryptophan--tRNA ligase [Vulcanimicrobium alpinum]|uniref:Tryptophan--tRNA ligase n=1 Tax=Vulcanimicrobium alpinum TaxID=3016050 RepID=A0AAN1XZJ2_UNVUL|nr:tryptophan--tRNA ligase [Vulcanimicrobium alpinum]BDE08224.1 tryptophan--tRNA ligase [Vulcanimicrobium alpinum]
MARPVVFSGIQPTGSIHIGNYFGAIKQWVTGQDDAENIFCLVDMHALTVPQDPAALRAQILETATVLLAAGIDPAKSRLFVQSDVREHGELTWYLSCVAAMGQLGRMTQYKEKSEAQRGEVRVGLFAYPLLMAADILLYRTTHVPVGEDQKQHIELTRDLAQRFNAAYGGVFVLPEPAIPAAGARIMGLDDPTKKMSKSVAGSYHAIRVLDPPEQIRKAVMSAQTDSGREIRIDPARPGVTNLLAIYMAASGTSAAEAEAHFAGARGYGDVKKELVDLLVETLRPLRERYAELAADPATVHELLCAGADAVRPIARATADAAKRAMGVGS